MGVGFGLVLSFLLLAALPHHFDATATIRLVPSASSAARDGRASAAAQAQMAREIEWELRHIAGESTVSLTPEAGSTRSGPTSQSTEKMATGVRVLPSRPDGFFEILVSDHDPELAVATVNSLAHVFVSGRAGRRGGETAGPAPSRGAVVAWEPERERLAGDARGPGGMDFELVETAYLKAVTRHPARLAVFLLGIAIGLFVLTGPSLARTLVYPTVSSEVGLRALANVPVLVSIPRIRALDASSIRRRVGNGVLFVLLFLSST